MTDLALLVLITIIVFWILLDVAYTVIVYSEVGRTLVNFHSLKGWVTD